MPNYMLLLYADEPTDEAEIARRDADLPEWKGAARRARSANGSFVANGRLHPSTTATTVRVRDHETELTDGPFAVTKEILGGYFILELRGPRRGDRGGREDAGRALRLGRGAAADERRGDDALPRHGGGRRGVSARAEPAAAGGPASRRRGRRRARGRLPRRARRRPRGADPPGRRFRPRRRRGPGRLRGGARRLAPRRRPRPPRRLADDGGAAQGDRPPAPRPRHRRAGPSDWPS